MAGLLSDLEGRDARAALVASFRGERGDVHYSGNDFNARSCEAEKLVSCSLPIRHVAEGIVQRLKAGSTSPATTND